MKRVLLSLSSGLVVACSTPAKPAAESPPAATRSEMAVHAEFTESCRAECERSRQAQAVAWEMIVAECERQCEEAWNAPKVESIDMVSSVLHTTIRATGTIDLGGDVPMLLLEGGKVTLSSGPAILDLTKFAQKKVTLVGTIRNEGDSYAIDGVSGVVVVE